MRNPAHLLLPALLLTSPLALAQEQPAPATAPAAPSKSVRLSYTGPLREAVHQVAEQGNLNVVITGEVGATPVDIHLRGMSAEEALRALARTHGLRMTREGSLIVLSPGGTASPALAPAAPLSPPPPVPSPDEHSQLAGQAALEDSHEVLEQAMEHMQEERARMQEERERIREHMREERERIRERMQEERERIRERMRLAREAGHSGRDVVARAQTLKVREDEVVDSAVVYGGDMEVEGLVEGDAVAFGGNIHVLGHVEGDVSAFGGNVVLGPESVVEGDVSAFGGTVTRQEGATVEGSVNAFGGDKITAAVAKEMGKSIAEARVQEPRHEMGSSFGGRVASFLLAFAMLFAVGFAGQMFFPARMKELGAEISSQPLRSGVVGFLGLLAMLPISLVLTITIIGIPVIAALWVAVLVLTVLSFSMVASELGMRLPVLRGRKTQAVILALGLIALLLIGHIPVLGPVVLSLASLVAFGAVIRTRFGYRPRHFPPEPVMDSQPAV